MKKRDKPSNKGETRESDYGPELRRSVGEVFKKKKKKIVLLMINRYVGIPILRVHEKVVVLIYRAIRCFKRANTDVFSLNDKFIQILDFFFILRIIF